MEAICLKSPKCFEKIVIPSPNSPGPDEVLVRVHRVGICGTDFGGFLGKMPFFSYPRIPGHELGVEIIAVGSNVQHVQPGQRCSVEPYINCQQCYSCLRGLTNCCEYHKTLGVMCDGGLTERILLPARKVHPSEKLSYDQLALVETLAIGCHAIDRSGLENHHVCLIIGAGPIGLSAVEFARISGARVVVMDVSSDRLQFCKERMKVDHTIQLDPQNRPQTITDLATLTNGRLADVVIDATGNQESMSGALDYCAFGGKLVYVGITQSSLTFLHAPVMHRRELSILASRNALSRDFARIIHLIEEGRIDTQPWITHHASFDQMIDEFPNWLKPENRVIKAIVQVGD